MSVCHYHNLATVDAGLVFGAGCCCAGGVTNCGSHGLATYGANLVFGAEGTYAGSVAKGFHENLSAINAGLVFGAGCFCAGDVSMRFTADNKVRAVTGGLPEGTYRTEYGIVRNVEAQVAGNIISHPESKSEYEYAVFGDYLVGELYATHSRKKNGEVAVDLGEVFGFPFVANIAGNAIEIAASEGCIEESELVGIIVEVTES